MATGRVNRLAPDVWDRLSTSPPRGPELTARLALPDVSDRLLAGIDVQGYRHLLVRLTEGERDLQDTQSRGLSVRTTQLTVSGESEDRYLDLLCNDPNGHQALDLIGGELADQIAAKSEPAVAIERILGKWRRFWGQVPGQLLSIEAQIGLLTEVWFLARWLIPTVGAQEALECWRGPNGARHDFERKRQSFEAKGTLSKRGCVHTINGIEQLAPPSQGELFLFSLQLREEKGGDVTLPGEVAACRDRLLADNELVSAFEAQLAKAGFTPAHEPEYSRLVLRVAAQGLYAVKDRFPRLTPQSLRDGVPSGIEHVSYEIDLGGFGDLMVTDSPTNFGV